MVIDIHTHIFPDKIAAEVIENLSKKSRAKYFSDGTLSGLLDSMKKFGVDKSVVLPVATAPRQVEKINSYAAAMNEKFFAQGIIYFGCIHPDFENFRAELSRVKNLGLKGIKIHPIYQGVNLDDKKFLQILYRAAELDLIVVTHAGLDIGFPGVVNCSPEMARHVVKEIGEFKFVLAHMGGWKNWDEVAEVLAGTNIFMDTAFSTGTIPARSDFVWRAEDLKLLSVEGFMKLYKIFGADKILFGTDSPWSSPKTSIDFIKNLPISDVEKKKILGGNAEKLLTL
ncbi:MAG: amidohydrolase family protein [Selenomonadaceae bacterium]|nr:amidohydrolase family protein [Selenomonadaceae bacterium]